MIDQFFPGEQPYPKALLAQKKNVSQEAARLPAHNDHAAV